MPAYETMEAAGAAPADLPLWFQFGGRACLPGEVTERMSDPSDFMKFAEQCRNKASQAKLSMQANALKLLSAGDSGDGDHGAQRFFDELAYGAKRLKSLGEPLVFQGRVHCRLGLRFCLFLACVGVEGVSAALQCVRFKVWPLGE